MIVIVVLVMVIVIVIVDQTISMQEGLDEVVIYICERMDQVGTMRHHGHSYDWMCWMLRTQMAQMDRDRDSLKRLYRHAHVFFGTYHSHYYHLAWMWIWK